MGHKINPEIYRISNGQFGSKVTDGHKSKWFASTDAAYRKYALEDYQVRQFLHKRLGHAGIGSIVIDRPHARNTLVLYLEVVKPGIVIGHRGKEIDDLCDTITKRFGYEVAVNVQEIRKPDSHPVCIASRIARQLEARVHYRRVMKMALIAASRSGVKGVSVTCKGRISQIARTEKKSEGSVPLSTLREKVQQAVVHANTRSGKVGVRVTVSYGPLTSRKKRLEKKTNEPEVVSE